ncbi:hypothetical protein DKZ23_00035 [Limosilactobacillus reuteri]|uniref:Addiction module toxin RelE n=1 Tax=Limosilactobacillus reuteri TaxID=1598 RepID=A0A317GK82_LIMRT|nr:hypothetical protein DKZ23_00035 [Limosilactobacillus reuteri]PWT54461.1 hypothetical protein DKZ33_00035 [Limosilactobacillus reuteri]PWT65107.1 hypothetical protein DKZ32_00035 [Limosilactobacillus reuteri]
MVVMEQPRYKRSYKRFTKKNNDLKSIKKVLKAIQDNDHEILSKHKKHKLFVGEYYSINVDRSKNDDILLSTCS